jgi:hypothetical protein
MSDIIIRQMVTGAKPLTNTRMTAKTRPMPKLQPISFFSIGSKGSAGYPRPILPGVKVRISACVAALDTSRSISGLTTSDGRLPIGRARIDAYRRLALP